MPSSSSTVLKHAAQNLRKAGLLYRAYFEQPPPPPPLLPPPYHLYHHHNTHSSRAHTLLSNDAQDEGTPSQDLYLGHPLSPITTATPANRVSTNG